MAFITNYTSQASSVAPTAVENGLTVTAGKVGWGGSFVRNTAITGAYLITLADASFSHTNGTHAVGAAAAAHIKYYGYNNIVAPTNGTAAGLHYTRVTPAADINAVNVYGGASILELILTAAKVTSASSFNTTGHLSQLVVRGSVAQSTGTLWASRSTTVFYDGANLAEVRVHGIKAPEYFGGASTITTLTGLYIEAQKSASVTTAYGIYQAGANDSNYFAGASVFNTYGDFGSANRIRIGNDPLTGIHGIVLNSAVPLNIVSRDSGASSVINFQTGTSIKWQISQAGNWLAVTDNAYAIGQPGANRASDIYIANSINGQRIVLSGSTSGNTISWADVGGSLTGSGFDSGWQMTTGKLYLNRNGSPVYIGTSNGQCSTRIAVALGLATTSKATMLSRLTTAEKNAVAWDATDDGALVYDTTLKKFQVWNGTTLAWENCN